MRVIRESSLKLFGIVGIRTTCLEMYGRTKYSISQTLNFKLLLSVSTLIHTFHFTKLYPTRKSNLEKKETYASSASVNVS